VKTASEMTYTVSGGWGVKLYSIQSNLTLHSEFFFETKWQHSVVVSALASINVVNRHWAWLVLGWVIACGRVNHLGM